MSACDVARDIEGCQCPPVRLVSPCCPPVLRGTLGRGDAEALAAAFKALADPTRLRLVSFIAEQPRGEACVCHLTAPAGLSQPTVSHHLKLLHDAGLLAREKRGAWVYYRIVAERLEALRATLAPRVSGPRGARRA